MPYVREGATVVESGQGMDFFALEMGLVVAPERVHARARQAHQTPEPPGHPLDWSEICRAFVEGELDVPKNLARVVRDLYFDPQHEEFAQRNMCCLSNAFPSAFKGLKAISQFRGTAKPGAFLEG